MTVASGPARESAQRAKRRSRWIIAGVLLLALLLSLVLLFVLRRAVGLEQWVVSSLAKTVQAQTGLELGYEDIRYIPPYTVGFTTLTLRAPDGTEVLSCGSGAVVLDAAPTLGGRLTFRSVTLDGLEVRIEQRDDGTLVGFSGTRDEPEASPPGDVQRVTLSEVLELQAVRISDAVVRYKHPALDAPIPLRGIDASIVLRDGNDRAGAPVADSPDADAPAIDAPMTDAPAPKLHDVSVDVRDGALGLTIRADADLDRLRVNLERFDAEILLSDRSVTEMDPALRDLVDRVGARGEVALTIGGTLGLAPADTNCKIRMKADDVRLNVHEPYEVGTADARFELRERHLELEQMTLNGPNATVNVEGWLDFDARSGYDLAWEVRDTKLAPLVRSFSPDGNRSKVSGTLSCVASMQGVLGDRGASRAGSGTVSVVNGRLIGVPILSDLAAVLDIAVPSALGSLKANDRAEAAFTFTPDGVRVDKSVFSTNFFVARAKGTVSYGGELDLLVNAGPLEKLQENLGAVGSALGAVTDSILPYRVRGPAVDPKITPTPGG